jgi:uroporphyrinogen decarboxylase
VDVINIAHAFCDDPSEWVDWQYPDGSPVRVPAWNRIQKEGEAWVYRDADGTVLGMMPKGGYFFDQRFWPLANADESEFARLEKHLPRTVWRALTQPPWQRASQPDFWQKLEARAKELYEKTDYALAVGASGQLFEAAQFLVGTDNLMADLALNRRRAEALLDRIMELNISATQKLMKAVGKYVQMVKIGDDLGMQTGPLISPKMYREVFKPRYKEMYAEFTRGHNAKLYLHSCGSVYRLLSDIIETGVDILNPVQTSAAEMDPVRLKAEFGKDLVFWGGGCDTQSILSQGTPQRVREEVMEKVSILAPGGGFIFATVHNTMPETPAENILAMFETFHQVRDYPIGRL